jgi:radical SAM superfamily enzyme YgiQ (UPF0313 family)
MKTLLIRSDAPRVYGLGGIAAFPMGLGYVAAVLQSRHEIDVIDMVVEPLCDDNLAERVAAINPGIVGISSDTLSFGRAIEVAVLIKRLNPEIVVVIGGAHANAVPGEVLKYDCFDVCVHGECEESILELWRRIEAGRGYGDLPNVAYRKGNEIVINPRGELIEDLNTLPVPARELFPMEKYNSEFGMYVSPIYSLNTSRGCPYKCAFCSSNVLFGRKYRYRSGESVADEIEMLIDKYKCKGVYFCEDLFTGNDKRVFDICSEIRRRGLSVKWVCESRVNVSGEMLEVMKQAGCELVWFGVESGCERVLKMIDKEITIEQIKKVFAICKDIGLKAGASFVMGFPGETIEDMYKTVELAQFLKPSFAWFNIFTAYPTSRLYRKVVDESLYEKDIGHGIYIVKTDEFDRSKLEEIQRYAERKVNRSLKNFVSTISHKIVHGGLTPKRIAGGISYTRHYFAGK